MKDLNLKGTGLTVTQKCTLKCKLCCTFSPYYKEPKEFSYEVLSKSIDKYFQIVNHVGKFTLSGGEPFSHTELDRIIEKVSSYFSRIDVFEIITNGTIYPNNKLIDAIKRHKDKLSIMIDNYGELSKNIDKIKSLFDENNINYRIREYYGDNPHCGGWVDFGDFTQIHFKQEDIENKFKKCAYPQKLQFCFSTVNGEIHPCTPSKRCMDLGVIPRNENEYINLFDENISIEQQREKFKHILDAKLLTACAYCNGLCDDSKRFKPAEQL